MRGPSFRADVDRVAGQMWTFPITALPAAIVSFENSFFEPSATLPPNSPPVYLWFAVTMAAIAWIVLPRCMT